MTSRAATARDLVRHDHGVSRANGYDIGAHLDNASYELVPQGDRRRKRRLAAEHRAVDIAGGDGKGTDKGVERPL
jgi:hypothetical protein